MQVLITKIEWDDEGQGLEECALPTVVVMLDVPDDVDQIELEDNISETLSDSFGFCHNGFTWERLNPAHDTHAGGGYFPQRLGLMRWPKYPLEVGEIVKDGDERLETPEDNPGLDTAQWQPVPSIAVNEPVQPGEKVRRPKKR